MEPPSSPEERPLQPENTIQIRAEPRQERSPQNDIFFFISSCILEMSSFNIFPSDFDTSKIELFNQKIQELKRKAPVQALNTVDKVIALLPKMPKPVPHKFDKYHLLLRHSYYLPSTTFIYKYHSESDNEKNVIETDDNIE